MFHAMKNYLHGAILLIIVFKVTCEFPTVTINQGILQGVYQKTWKNNSFSAFLGIPYAKPPVGELRFHHPLPAEAWKDVYQATDYKSECSQIGVYVNDFNPSGSEDCLYLNVYTPKLKTVNKPLLPVMVFIHGGGFMCGNGNAFMCDPYLLLEKKIVFVTLNYRLGPLGFLSTGDAIVPGNNGLKDQNLALRWVKENIEHFGGDSEKITIFGQSAGGASVHFHMLSPLSAGLFHRAIAHSGDGLATWSFGSNSKLVKNTHILANYFNCSSSSSKELVSCLRNVKAEDITYAQKKFMIWSYDPMVPFKPTVEPKSDYSFLTNHPMEIMKSGEYNKVPLIIGFNSEDGAIKAAGLYNDSKLIKELNQDFIKLAPIIFQYDDKITNPDAVSTKIRHYYFEGRSIDENTKSEVGKLMTDAWTASSIATTIELNMKYSHQPTYFYLFGHKASVSYTQIFGDPSYDYGVCHNDELLYIFGFKPFEDTLLKHHKEMIEVMTTLWTNFAETGNPTPTIESNSLIKHKWDTTTSDSLNYYLISNNDIKMSKNKYLSRIKFWQNLSVSYANGNYKRIVDEL